jgi:hypothetical protein
MERNNLIAAALAAVIALCAWMGRYTIEPVGRGGDGGTAAAGYLLDRWTGKVTLLFAAQSIEVTPREPNK